MKTIEIPEKLNRILAKLEKSGHEAYIVGGCVRDLLLGVTPKDWDITTSAKPNEIKEVFKDYRLVTLGERFGTIGVCESTDESIVSAEENENCKTITSDADNIPHGNMCEITTFRREFGYNDGRHPDGVIFAYEIEDDLLRRDFTINGMAFNNRRGLVDLFGGLDDLKDGKIKTIGSAEKRFSEDGLRVIRAIRFAAQLGFSVENTTKSAIYDFASMAKRASVERLSLEFEKLLMGNFAQGTLKDYRDVLKYILGIEFKEDSPLNGLPKDMAIRLAAMMPGEFGHLKISRKIMLEADEIYSASRELLKRNGGSVDLKKAMRIYGYEVVRKGLVLNGEGPGCLDEIEKSGQCYNLKKLAIKGSDLDWLSGKEIGQTLEKLLTLVILGKLDNEANVLIEYAKNGLNNRV